MDFKVSKRKIDGISVLDMVGRITSGDALGALRQTIRDEVANGHHKILLNLKDVSYIDSSGLGELVMALGTVATVFKDEDGNWDRCGQCRSGDRKSWGQLKLSNAGRQVTDLLQFTKLYTVFDVHESEDEALKSFHG
jgi:anti-sigma B factor antagonist